MLQTIDLLYSATFAGNFQVDTGLKSSYTSRYAAVLCSVSPTNSSGYQNPGLPQKGAQPVVFGYTIQDKLIPQADKIAAIRLQKGRFILATNQYGFCIAGALTQ